MTAIAVLVQPRIISQQIVITRNCGLNWINGFHVQVTSYYVGLPTRVNPDTGVNELGN